MESDALSLDAVYGILSESRRRYLLYYFLENDHANVEGVALQLAAWEADVSIDAVTEARKRRVTTSLLHSHLPKLEDHDIVEYDDRTGDVIVGEGFDEIRETVRRARESEDEVPVAGPSRESFLYSEPMPSSNADRQ